MKTWHVHGALLLLVASITNGCGTHPTTLCSSQDIRRAPADLRQTVIGFLPIGDYALLSKFDQLQDVSFFTLDGTGANDQKLEALSKVKLPNLQGITLLNCPLVTDDGIRSLTNIASLRWMGLEGTSITDKALELMFSDMKLTAVNVANCPQITKQGLLKLASSTTLQEFGFSADALTQEDVVRLVAELRTTTWCGIIDPKGKLNIQALKELGQNKGVRIVVKKTGALQDVLNGDPLQKK